MNKNKKIAKKLLKLSLIFLVCFTVLFAGTLFNKKVVIADSGFDSSYDSGGSSDWGSSSSDWGSSSYDYDYGSSYGGSGGSGGSFFGSLVIFIIIVIIYAIATAGKKGNYTPPVAPTVDDTATLNKIKQFIPNFDKASFIADGYKIYLDVQNAWMNFKLEDVKNVISDELFNMYESQLDTLEVKGEQNIMKDFVMKSAYIKDVVKQNDNITITVCYVVEFYDYIVEQSSGKVLRGTSSNKIRMTYDMKFRKTLNENAVVTNCPNCGAKLENMNGAGTCSYCGSKIVSENSKWILTDKKAISQIRL